MADDTFEYITTDYMVSIDSGTPSVQPVEYIIELGEQGIPGVQGEQGEPGYSPVVNYTWNNDTIQFTLVNRDYTETTPNLYDYVLKKDGSNANNPITINGIKLRDTGYSVRIENTYDGFISMSSRGTIIGTNGYLTLGNGNASRIMLSPAQDGKAYYGATYAAENEIATIGDIPSVGNGTITLTQGGVTKGTFTTNQSGNTTIELDAGGGSISNPLNIGYTNQGVARSLNLGINTSSNKIVSSYTEITGGSYWRAPLYFLEDVASPLVGTVNGIGAIDLSINTMVGTDGTTDGVAGTVPAPLTTDAGKYLRADGTWATPSGGGGGTSDYTELTNKPRINSVILTGNKTSSDLGLQNELTQGTGISIVNDTISIDNTVALKTDIPSLAGYATQQWVTNQGYLTSISSSDVITALGYTPYSASNPNGYTNNVGTVTSVNNVQPDANGNVSINIPDVSNFVTTNTTQTILGDKTFTQNIYQTLGRYLITNGVKEAPGGIANIIVLNNSNIEVGNSSRVLKFNGSATRPTYNNNDLALLSDIGSGGGAVNSVNGQTGDVVLTASDIGALPDTIVIPTKTSDLTNDSGFITSSDIPTNYVTTNTTQSISGIKTFTNAIHADLIQNISGNANLFVYSNSSFSIGTANTRLFLYGNTVRPTYYYNGNTELALLSDIPTVPTTDQTYSSTSTNPQSGTAVAEAIASVTTPIATSTTVGTVKPDNTTTKVDANGTLSAICRNIGEIVQSTLPLTDAGLHLLDGSLILGGGIYQGFVDYIANIYKTKDRVYNPDAFTVVGSPTITDDGIASGFSSSNYINTGYEINTSNFEIRCKVKFNTQSIINAVASDGTNNTFMFTRRNNGILGLSYLASSDNSWKQINTSIAIDNDKWNYCIFGAKNGKIYFYHSYTSFEDVTLIGEQANTISGTYDKTVWISANYDHSRYIEGSIDLKQFSITVDGKEVFSGSKPAKYFTDETTWQTSVTTYGSCGKFVYNSTNNTVRLPKVSDILQGTTDISALGDLVEESLPNIGLAEDGSIVAYNIQLGTSSDTYHFTSNPTHGMNGDTGIMSNNAPVQPQTIKTLLYIVIATSSKTDIQVDIDEIATDLNGKADTDLSNITATGKTVIDGQWVDAGYVLLSNATALGSYTIDLSSYLPNDNYKYEVLIFGRIGSHTSDVNYYKVRSTIVNTDWTVIANGSNGGIDASAVVFPIGTDHTITTEIASNNGNAPYWTECRLMAYRRIGTNS